MTLENLKNRCKDAGFRYAYGLFKKPTEPPHLIALITGTDNFMADNKVYRKQIPIQLDYTYLVKDLEKQNIIEDRILGDVPWNKTDETYLSDEEVWQVSYFFEIDNKESNSYSI